MKKEGKKKKREIEKREKLKLEKKCQITSKTNGKEI